MPSAFVLMPFEQEFDEIYTQFIRATLEEAGFSVKRADDLENQQNILRDIIGAIRAADLVVADLTSLNPNVFYELGVAHALRKRVILLSQDISGVPFDLRSYGIVICSTQFAQFETARKKFLSLAKGAARGTVPFVSLFTDFAVETTGRPPFEVSQPDERGFLDHQIGFEEGCKDLIEVFQSVSVATKEINAPTQELNQGVAGLRARGGSEKHRAASPPLPVLFRKTERLRSGAFYGQRALRASRAGHQRQPRTNCGPSSTRHRREPCESCRTHLQT